MKKWIIITLIISFLIISALAYCLYSIGLFDFIFGKSGSNTGTVQNVTYNVTKQNLIPFLESQQFVKALPKDMVILLKLFNTNTGEKEWEENYIIKKSSVKQTQLKGSPDITINLHSKYISFIGQDFCGTLKTAKNNGEMYIETGLSTIQLIWKMKSMLKYRDCLGI